jgi:hypothetical protein
LNRFRPEWEWGWRSPLLCAPDPRAPSLSLPDRFSDLLDPSLLDRIDLDEADRLLERSLAGLTTSRLGVRFERVQETLFRLHPATRSLRANLAIPGRTEVDLLQETVSGDLLHWEIAVKFYLGLDSGGSTDAGRWIGPGLRDTLGAKLRVIRERQLGALETLEGRRVVGLADDAPVRAFAKVHGILFRPLESTARPGASITLPAGVRAEAPRGLWAPLSTLGRALEAISDTKPGFRLLSDRNRWIQDQRYVAGTPWESPTREFLESIRAAVLPEGRPVMIASSREDLRLFVVPDDWASRAHAAVDTIRASGRIES